MDSGGWIVTEEEEEDNVTDPTKLVTIPDILKKRLLAQEKAKGRIEVRGENTAGWGILPDLIIEQIFSYLSIRDRYSASLVCKQWNRAFYMQRTWNTFELTDTTLSRRKYNHYSGWQYRLDHLRTQVCILRVGKLIRRLVLMPVWNLMTAYEFMMLASFYQERRDKDPMSPCLERVTSLRFVFWCNMANRQEQLVYGTGGEMLRSLQRLMGNLRHLRTLELIDLLLVPQEAVHLLDDVCVHLTDKLQSLTLINATKEHFNMIHPGVFINLRILKISPQNLGDEVVEMLLSHGRLEQLVIIQNSYTERAIPVEGKTWEKVGRKFDVLLKSVGKLYREVIWQEKAPVVSVMYDCPTAKVSWESVLTVIELYNYTLKEYGHLGLPKFTGSRKFCDRADGPLLTLCRKCPYLTTVIIRERISTSTAMLIAGMSPNLKHFLVRKNALVKKCDYQFHNLDLDNNFTMWIKLNCRDFEKMTREIAKVLGYDWTPLTDSQFKVFSRQRQAY